MTRHNLSLCAAAVTFLLRGGLADVTGEWSAVATFDRASGRKNSERRVELVCALEQHDGTLTGACRPLHAPEGTPVSGTAHERNVEWSFEIAPNATAKKQTATFRGTVDAKGSMIKGTFQFGDSRGDFRAKKQ